MNVDQRFRIVLGIYIAVVLPIGMYYRLRSHTAERLDRWQEGLFILFGLRLTGLAAAVAGIAWLIDPDWMAWSNLPLPVAVRWTGLAIAVLGGLLVTWTFHHLGQNLTDTVVTRQQHSLVTSGPYQFVRNPFYVAGLLAATGCALMMANGFVLALAILGFGLLSVRTRVEEQKLVERFGDEYRDYMRRVGRFVPRLVRTRP
jgi:protein-S-isoprenylcysteine O-methyltransferase Ste14